MSKGLALGQVLDDVYQDHVGVAQLVDPLGGRGSNVSGSYYGYFASHLVSAP
jgi:hypothetical protein